MRENYLKETIMFQFLVDATLTILTGGLWLIRVFCREMNG
jgi:hypothetical protein